MTRFQIIVATIVTLIWAAGFTVSYVDRSFSPPAELSGIMLVVAGWLFGRGLRDVMKGDDGDEEKKK